MSYGAVPEALRRACRADEHPGCPIDVTAVRREGLVDALVTLLAASCGDSGRGREPHGRARSAIVQSFAVQRLILEEEPGAARPGAPKAAKD